jgi:hypothetical protein
MRLISTDILKYTGLGLDLAANELEKNLSMILDFFTTTRLLKKGSPNFHEKRGSAGVAFRLKLLAP